MNTHTKILNLEASLRVLKNQNLRERQELINNFSKKINKLIEQTPTGDLRNEYTDLNILFNLICETLT